MRFAAAAGARVAQTRSLNASWLYAGRCTGDARDVEGEVLRDAAEEPGLLRGAKVEVTNSISDGGKVEVLAGLLPVSSFGVDAEADVEMEAMEETDVAPDAEVSEDTEPDAETGDVREIGADPDPEMEVTTESGVDAEVGPVRADVASSCGSSGSVSALDLVVVTSVGSSAGRASVQRKKSTESSVEASVAASTEAKLLLSAEVSSCGSCASVEVLIDEAGTRGGGEEDRVTSSLGPLDETEVGRGSSAVLFLLSVEVEACCLKGGRGGVDVEAFLISTCLSSRPL